MDVARIQFGYLFDGLLTTKTMISGCWLMHHELESYSSSAKTALFLYHSMILVGVCMINAVP